MKNKLILSIFSIFNLLGFIQPQEQPQVEEPEENIIYQLKHEEEPYLLYVANQWVEQVAVGDEAKEMAEILRKKNSNPIDILTLEKPFKIHHRITELKGVNLTVVENNNKFLIIME